MNCETVHNVTLPKLGFGTWKIGGNSSPNFSRDSRSLSALRYALEIGYTHFDTAEMYAGGHAEELVGRAIRESGIERKSVFITTKVMPPHLKYEQVLAACEGSLKRLGMEYIDLYLIHWPESGMKLAETFRALNQLVREGRVKNLGVSNFSLKLLQRSETLSETPILTNQVPYSLADRSYVRNGVLEYCRQNDIVVTAYSPLDEGCLHVNKTLQAIANSHRAAPYQIALAWIVSQPRLITIPMSFDPAHIKENIEAVDIVLTEQETQSLDELA